MQSTIITPKYKLKCWFMVQTFCDFLVYAKDGIIHQTILQDADFIPAALPKMEVFWDRYIACELLTI